MSIPWLLTGHIQKLGQKWDKQKAEVEKWVNVVGGRIKKELKRAYDEAESVIDVQLYNSGRGEYAIQLSNGRWLVVNLTNGTCSCRWWQISRISMQACHGSGKEEEGIGARLRQPLLRLHRKGRVIRTESTLRRHMI